MTPSPSRRQTLSWIALAAVAVALLWLLAPVLTPFIVGAVLAYALHPLVEALARRRWPRVLAVLLVETLAIVAVLAVLLLLVPVILQEVPLLREQIPQLAARFNEVVTPWLAQYGVDFRLDTASVKDLATRLFGGNVEEWIAAVLASARIGGSFVLTVIGNAVLIPVVLFFLLMDWPRLVDRVAQLIPPRLRPQTVGFFTECDALLGQYLRGQLLVMVILAVFYSTGLALFGFDLALPVGVFTGLAVFVPYLGYGLGLVLALLSGLLQFAGWHAVIAVAVVYGLGQLIESFLLTPYLVGERIGLNPLAVIFALLAFGHLFGFVGVLVALPLSAVGLVALRRLQRLYVDSPLYTG